MKFSYTSVPPVVSITRISDAGSLFDDNVLFVIHVPQVYIELISKNTDGFEEIKSGNTKKKRISTLEKEISQLDTSKKLSYKHFQDLLTSLENISEGLSDFIRKKIIQSKFTAQKGFQSPSSVQFNVYNYNHLGYTIDFALFSYDFAQFSDSIDDAITSLKQVFIRLGEKLARLAKKNDRSNVFLSLNTYIHELEVVDTDALLKYDEKSERAAVKKSAKSQEHKISETVFSLYEGISLAHYNFKQYLASITKPESSLKEKEVQNEAEKKFALHIVVGGNDFERFKRALPGKKTLENLTALTEAVKITRNLVNLPPNLCFPRDLVKCAKQIASENDLKLEIFEKQDLQKMKAGGLLGVSQGSDEPPYLIKLSYIPAGRKGMLKSKHIKKICLVGKGVTFDSGGLSIKPAQSMEEMKGDMGGAASVLGAMEAISRIKPPIAVTAFVPTTENMISGKAMRPGDVITTLAQKTVEVLNTDAEGRLILADALTLAAKEEPDIIVDTATLTGAIVVGLGEGIAGYYCEDKELARDLELAARCSGEAVWRMPLHHEYSSDIKSSTADIKNVTAHRWGGSITAALFLKEFVPMKRWIHIDLAGPALNPKLAEFEGTGFPGFGVRTLVRFVLGQAFL
jgi:leucyl aminopeptidase